MRHKISLLSFAALLLCFSVAAQQAAFKPLGKKKQLLWREEFNYTGLPDSTRWGYEKGFVRNKERQYYTEARLENSRVEDGHLVLESRRERYDTAAYTSASINTFGKQQFAGDIRVEVRAMLPSGKGIWPAIWMMGVNREEVGWPKCSEIDIMEFVGHTPRTVWGTVHWWDSTANNAQHYLSKGDKLLMDDLHSTYHIFGMERKGSQLQFFVDNHYYFRFSVPPTAWPGSFTAPLYLLLNTAVGGSWGGEVDDNIFPQKFYVDYVRVYHLK